MGQNICFRYAFLLIIASSYASLVILIYFQSESKAAFSVLIKKIKKIASPRILCSTNSTSLQGELVMNISEMQRNYDILSANFVDNARKHPPNFSFEPSVCSFYYSVAVIVPFRGREEQLPILLGHLHPILERQLIRYQIFVINQVGKFTFNKGRLMNAGFLWVHNSSRPFDCYIFHDVDMLPENDKNLYRCHNATDVWHISCSVDKFRYYPLCCGMTVGGVVAFLPDQFIKVNGFPNTFWGWGGEDDAIYNRILKTNMTVSRPLPHRLCRFTMLKHERDKKNPRHNRTLVKQMIDSSTKMYQQDGINNLNVKIVSVVSFPLYVNVSVDVGEN